MFNQMSNILWMKLRRIFCGFHSRELRWIIFRLHIPYKASLNIELFNLILIANGVCQQIACVIYRKHKPFNYFFFALLKTKFINRFLFMEKKRKPVLNRDYSGFIVPYKIPTWCCQRLIPIYSTMLVNFS